jgi:vanillate O-demethylase ferredoxin subunit
LPPFSAGAHIDVHAAPGLVRQYSLCNDPGETHRYVIGVLRDAKSRGGSLAMHALQEAQVVAISHPRNHFALTEEAPHSLLLAGGIGITPLLSMARRLHRLGRPFEMHYGSRTSARTAFLETIGQSAFAPSVHLHFDDGPVAQRLDARAILGAQPAGAHLYVCGPAGFMDAILAAAREAGWREERLHREYFNAAPVHTSGDGSFEVQVASTGAVIRVDADRSVAAALAAAGIEVPTSCEQGVCGICVTRVLEGTPDHRDMYLTPHEQARGGQFTPCCSRAKSARLVLDL